MALTCTPGGVALTRQIVSAVTRYAKLRRSILVKQKILLMHLESMLKNSWQHVREMNVHIVTIHASRKGGQKLK
ncbi:hypothetical protein C4Z15_000810 [Enterobacter hormaechei subsp. xiangfangensis]|nr:hypothetical protein C4Z15_000810 [Enterobacter hormaechei subsp. xiangfangensis]